MAKKVFPDRARQVHLMNCAIRQFPNLRREIFTGCHETHQSDPDFLVVIVGLIFGVGNGGGHALGEDRSISMRLQILFTAFLQLAALSPDAVIIIEVGAREDVDLPDWCETVETRIYGGSKMIIVIARPIFK